VPTASLLWIPDLGCDGDYYADIKSELPPKLRGSIVDISEAQNLTEIAQAVISRLIGPTVLIGGSMGGWVAQRVAAMAGQRVSTLVLLTTWARRPLVLESYLNNALALMDACPPQPQQGRQMTTKSFHPNTVTSIQIQPMMDMGNRVGPDTTRSHINAIFNEPSVVDFHSQIKAPALVFSASHDALVDSGEAQFIAQSLPDARLVMLDAGHACVWEYPKLIADEMAAWIQNHQ
jgi:pimeloyl-ACP methyl ester carboxylesterase